MFVETEFFLHNIWKDRRDGSNSVLFTDQKQDQLLLLVGTISLQDIFKIVERILFCRKYPISTTDYSFFTDSIFFSILTF